MHASARPRKCKKMMLPALGLTLAITGTLATILNPKGPIHQNYSASCIMEVVQHQFTPHKLVTILTTPNMSTAAFGVQNQILEIMNQLLKWPLEVLSGKLVHFESSEICLNCPPKDDGKKILKNNFQPKYKTEFCVMVVDNFVHFCESLSNYVVSGTQNFHAYFLVYVSEIRATYEKLAEDILVSLWGHKILNAAVIIGRNNLRTFNIYGLDVYAPSELCGLNPKLLLMNTCKKGKLDKSVALFGNNLPGTFQNCSIQTIAMKYPPFIIDKESGFEVSVLRQLGNILNITFNLTVVDAVDWGVRESRNNWTGPLQQAIDESAIAIGNVMANPDLEEDFDLSVGYFYERMVWVVPIALPIPRWQNIFVIFRYKLWLTTIAYFILTAILFQVLATKFGENLELPRFKELGTNFLTSLRVLLGNASPQHPQTMAVRTTFMSLTSYSMLMVVLYQTFLITHLMNPVYEKQISTVQDILDSGQGIGGLNSYKEFFNVSSDDRAMKIYQMFEIYETVNDTAYNWILTVADDRDTCTVSSSFYVKFLLAEHDHAVTTTHGEPKIFVLKEVLFVYPIRMVLPNGFPLSGKFNEIIWYLLNGGIVEEWARRYHRHMKRQNDTDTDHEDEDAQKLTIDHLQGAFNLLFFGYTFGAGFLLLELVASRFGKTKKFKELKRRILNKQLKV